MIHFLITRQLTKLSQTSKLSRLDPKGKNYLLTLMELFFCPFGVKPWETPVWPQKPQNIFINCDNQASICLRVFTLFNHIVNMSAICFKTMLSAGRGDPHCFMSQRCEEPPPHTHNAGVVSLHPQCPPEVPGQQLWRMTAQLWSTGCLFLKV